MIGWLFGIGLRRPVAIRWRKPSRATRQWVRRHQGHGLTVRRGGPWWCGRCGSGHHPRYVNRWRIN